MARTVDTSKIDKVREAAMKLIVEKGYGGATISEIARLAGVSDGYLYRHYESKRELVQDLYRSNIQILHDEMENILGRVGSISEFFREYINFLYTVTISDPKLFWFCHMLLYDYSFSLPIHPIERIVRISKNVLEKGRSTGEISSKRDPEEVFSVMIGVPVKFLDTRMRHFFWQREITVDDVEKVADICIKALS